MHSVFQVGTTIYDPDRAYNGYTLLNRSPVWKHDERGVLLIDMNGNTVHMWDRATLREFTLLDNGNLLAAEVDSQPARIPLRRSRVREYDWNDQLVWAFEPPPEALLAEAYFQLSAAIRAERLESGNTLVVYKRVVPWEYRSRISMPGRRRRVDYLADCLVEVTPRGEVVWEWKSYEHFDMDQFLEIDQSANWTHFNSLQVLPDNQWYRAGDLRFCPGNLLMSPRTLGFVFVIDRESGEVIWRSDGHIDLSGQHAPRMVEDGLPGAGNILVLDNGVPPLSDVYRVGMTRALEINPITFEIEWSYQNGYRFFTPFTGNAQRLPNGNTLLCESLTNRMFEVTRSGMIVWECVLDPVHVGIDTCYRYPYGYCEQMSALGTPTEDAVSPPPNTMLEARPFAGGDHHTRSTPVGAGAADGGRSQ